MGGLRSGPPSQDLATNSLRHTHTVRAQVAFIKLVLFKLSLRYLTESATRRNCSIQSHHNGLDARKPFHQLEPLLRT